MAEIVKIGDKSLPRTAVVVDNGIEISHVTQSKSGTKIYLSTIIDLSDENSNDVLINAAYNYLIQVIRPRVLKTLSDKDLMDSDGKTFKPMDYPPDRKSKKTVTERASDALLKLSETEFIDMMVEDYGMDTEKAEELYIQKHSA